MALAFLKALRARFSGPTAAPEPAHTAIDAPQPAEARPSGAARPAPPRPVSAAPCIWLHAAGESEAISGLELFRRLREEDDSLRCLLSTEEPLPAALAEPELLGATETACLPTDSTRDAVAWLADHAPTILIWTGPLTHPVLLQKSQQRAIEMMLADSVDANPPYRRRKEWRTTSTRAILRRFGLILAASETAARSYEQQGAARERIKIIGGLEEGSIHLPCDELEYRSLSDALAARPIWLAARTTKDEEAILAEVHRRVTRMSHRLLLVVAPDDAARIEAACEAFRGHGWRAEIYERERMPAEDTQVLIGDPAQLGLWYRVSPVTFMGGTLSGTGGAHPFAPATLGSAILYGNYTDPFQTSYGRLVRAGAARLVLNSDGLEVNLRDLQAPDKVAQMAHAAWEICSRGAEVTDFLVERVFELIDAGEADHART
ncbi:3-deoxy-D-manno-octulosonic acid transferase [Pseudoruegeria aquimaris]|uniref:3-deoxy-D-manno-octulosonic acid transferase n=1 Tax=Pseudoruegeria aquimaris TaxID=393663 RepID=A0A1Y5TPX0_9RHOB|nr:glycosyltransferase N-terminal domain-containing protein [Pseudoruegeria aquimaris]SLN69349.1 3-deoxy-D-manno-octulosonic acid transferase [Pseudoruegeria aquimaris]